MRLRLRRRKTVSYDGAIAAVRKQYRALGIPEAHLTDEDLVAVVRAVARACRQAGMSFEDAQRALASSALAGPAFAEASAALGRNAISAAQAAEQLAHVVNRGSRV